MGVYKIARIEWKNLSALLRCLKQSCDFEYGRLSYSRWQKSRDETGTCEEFVS